ncbi:hypothetical protein HPB50_016155 [Hyalomma asiaticum]|uniref:Uncharacterized protein n=1 Tax=Hyalomma asiaticum TaxID=266040 RepID=A0ACB7TCP2_HYAAI|nr:hypothetical protein HPB50_016155 [Hyalomma asiaticum]
MPPSATYTGTLSIRLSTFLYSSNVLLDTVDSDSPPAPISQACTESANINLSGSYDIPSTNSKNVIRKASEERVCDVPQLEPPGHSTATTQADDQHNAAIETFALNGAACMTTGAPSDSHAGSRTPTVNCSVCPLEQSPLEVNDRVSMHTTCLISTAPLPDTKRGPPARTYGTADVKFYSRDESSSKNLANVSNAQPPALKVLETTDTPYELLFADQQNCMVIRIPQNPKGKAARPEERKAKNVSFPSQAPPAFFPRPKVHVDFFLIMLFICYGYVIEALHNPGNAANGE